MPKLILVFFQVQINSGIFLTAKIIRVFFQPENKYGIFHAQKNKYCIYFCAGQRVDRTGGQSGQKSVHLVEKKLSDFSGLSLTLFYSVQYCHLGKIQ